MSIPEWLIYRNKTKDSEIEVRKIGHENSKEVGITVTRQLYDMPGNVPAEFFLDRDNAVKLIKALMKYFDINMIHIQGV